MTPRNGLQIQDMLVKELEHNDHGETGTEASSYGKDKEQGVKEVTHWHASKPFRQQTDITG
ncbi:hypothetical protein IFM47457_09546 [Aspergillus lentulus]|nr:hypothetical protein IFM47457_09546 [Aspergillus lentulus]